MTVPGMMLTPHSFDFSTGSSALQAEVDFSDFVVVDASTYGTMTRLALIGCNGSGKSTVIDAFAVSVLQFSVVKCVSL